MSAALERRGDAWCELGASSFIDFARYHEQLRMTQWKIKLQPTWRRYLLIRDVALGNGIEGRKERMLKAQWEGRDIAYVDFWPLPNANVGSWSGSALKNAPSYLEARELYKSAVRDTRRDWIQRHLAERAPDTVIIVAGAALRRELDDVIDWTAPLEQRSTGRDRYCLTRLPKGGLLLAMSQARGTTNQQLEDLGKLVMKHLHR
jgi:hypothetical protein